MNATNTTTAITPEYADTPDPTYIIRPTHQYTDRQKREALRLLAERNGNCRATARITGIPWTTLRGWSQQMPHVYESFDNTARANSADTPDTLAAPDPGPLVHALTERADLLIAAITPERIAEAKLPQIARALAAILPRIDALRRTAAATDQRIVREDFIHDISYILRHHIFDKDLLHRIALAHFAPFPEYPNTAPDLPETAITSEAPADSPDLADATASEASQPSTSASRNAVTSHTEQEQSDTADNPSLYQNPLLERSSAGAHDLSETDRNSYSATIPNPTTPAQDAHCTRLPFSTFPQSWEKVEKGQGNGGQPHLPKKTYLPPIPLTNRPTSASTPSRSSPEACEPV